MTGLGRPDVPAVCRRTRSAFLAAAGFYLALSTLESPNARMTRQAARCVVVCLCFHTACWCLSLSSTSNNVVHAAQHAENVCPRSIFNLTFAGMGPGMNGPGMGGRGMPPQGRPPWGGGPGPGPGMGMGGPGMGMGGMGMNQGGLAFLSSTSTVLNFSLLCVVPRRTLWHFISIRCVAPTLFDP